VDALLRRWIGFRRRCQCQNHNGCCRRSCWAGLCGNPFVGLAERSVLHLRAQAEQRRQIQPGAAERWGSSEGNITLQVTVYNGQTGASTVLPVEVLSPGEFRQLSGILSLQGLQIQNGYARVERVSGTAPFYRDP
jgi:hypothetical protein